jgi:hypothetical protein
MPQEIEYPVGFEELMMVVSGYNSMINGPKSAVNLRGSGCERALKIAEEIRKIREGRIIRDIMDIDEIDIGVSKLWLSVGGKWGNPTSNLVQFLLHFCNAWERLSEGERIATMTKFVKELIQMYQRTI